MTALMWAAHNGHCDTCKLLLESGANIDFQDAVSAFLNLQTFTTNKLCSEGDGGAGGAAWGGGGGDWLFLEHTLREHAVSTFLIMATTPAISAPEHPTLKYIL